MFRTIAAGWLIVDLIAADILFMLLSMASFIILVLIISQFLAVKPYPNKSDLLLKLCPTKALVCRAKSSSQKMGSIQENDSADAL